MSKFKSILTVFLLANFLVCSIHCQLGGKAEPAAAAVSLASYDHLSVNTPERACEGCNVCDWVHAGGIYVSNFSFQFDHAIIETFWNFDLTREHSLSSEVSLGVLTTSPPHLVNSRHFVFRTALPARAPSALS